MKGKAKRRNHAKRSLHGVDPAVAAALAIPDDMRRKTSYHVAGTGRRTKVPAYALQKGIGSPVGGR